MKFIIKLFEESDWGLRCQYLPSNMRISIVTIHQVSKYYSYQSFFEVDNEDDYETDLIVQHHYMLSEMRKYHKKRTKTFLGYSY